MGQRQRGAEVLGGHQLHDRYGQGAGPSKIVLRWKPTRSRGEAMDKKKLQIAKYWGAACGGATFPCSTRTSSPRHRGRGRHPYVADRPRRQVQGHRGAATASSTWCSTTVRSAPARTSTSRSCCGRRASAWWRTAPARISADPRPGEPVLQGRDLREGLPEEPVDPGREHRRSHASHQGRGGRARDPRLLQEGLQARRRRRRRLLPSRCPPAPEQVKAVITWSSAASRCRPREAWSALPDRAVCDDCQRKKEEKKVKQFYRPWQIIQDPEKCLMEQGSSAQGPPPGPGAASAARTATCRAACLRPAAQRRGPGRENHQRGRIDHRQQGSGRDRKDPCERS